MSEIQGLQRLLTWLSPAFPVGTFAWSGGLETAITDRRVADRVGTEDWIVGGLRRGGLRNDAIILAACWRAQADATALAEVAALNLALISASQRHAETLITGDAFITAAAAWPDPVLRRLPTSCPYPVAIGAVAAAHGIGLVETLIAFLTAAVHSQVSVAVRLVPLGQTAGLAVVAALEPAVREIAEHAASSSLADIGGIGYAADIAAMAHETLEPRIFRS